jgi:hypothetical protein
LQFTVGKEVPVEILRNGDMVDGPSCWGVETAEAAHEKTHKDNRQLSLSR